jgi:class 3 adenylate cyclase
LDYTVIGDVVNTAQRLQSAATMGQILVDESCYEKIKESFDCRKIGEILAKNKKKPVMSYEVVSLDVRFTVYDVRWKGKLDFWAPPFLSRKRWKRNH